MSMPAMPFGDPWPSIAWLLAAEQAIRLRRPEPSSAGIAPYWLDLARLLRIKVIYKDKDMRQLAQIKNEMSSPVFDAYIRGRQIAATQWPKKQPELPGISAGPQGITAK